MKLKGVLAGTLLFAAGSLFNAAFAQGYVGASVGQSDYKVDCTGLTTCDTKDTGYKLFGGYMFTPNLGIEGGWVDLGETTSSVALVLPGIEGGTIVGAASAVLKASGPFLAAVAAAPIGSGSVFGKLGVANLKSELTASTFGQTETTSVRATDAFFGIGASYGFSRNFSVRAEWERFRIKWNNPAEKDDVDLLSVGATYRF